MSTQLALGVVGAGIGFFFGSPQLGFVIGSLIGGLLDPPKVEGPRLGDLKLQQSTYGKMIPFVWGTGRMAGTMIDQTDLEEHKQKSGGKGGPQVTNYTYSASFDVMLCATPKFNEPAIRGISKIYADARLIWDVLTGDPCPCVVYLGDETQLPDPTFEAIHGVGEVPAYRGYAHCVFTDFYLTDFGNRIPALEFEVFTGSGDYPWQVSVGAPWNELNFGVAGFEYIDGEIIATSQKAAPKTARWEKFDLDLNSLEGPVYTTPVDGGDTSAINSNNWIGTPPATTDAFWEIYDNATGNLNQGLDVSIDFVAHPPLGNLAIVSGQDDEFWFGISGTPATLTKWHNGTGGFMDSTVVGSMSGNECALGTSDGYNEIYICWQQVGASELFKYDWDLNLLDHWNAAALSGTRLTDGSRGNFVVYKGQLAFNYVAGGGADRYIALINLGPGIAADSDQPLLPQAAEGRLATLRGGLVVNVNNGVFSLDPPAAPVLLSKIVGDLADMTPIDGAYDVSELTDDVRWFVVGSQMTVRNAIQALRQVFFFDGVESDDLLKFRKRSMTSIFEIHDDDLCGREYGEESGEPLRTLRTREQELPRTVTITFIDVERDYQAGTQSTPRQTVLSQQDTTVEVPVGLTADEAKQKCWSLITAAWIEREQFEWTTTRKWAHLEPCDVGLVRGRVIRILTRVESPNGVIRWTGVLAAPSIYTNDGSNIYIQRPGTGAPGDGWVPPDPPRPLVATQLIMLDIPLLAESDTTGPYAAVGPAADGLWPGCELYKSIDGGTTYTSVGGSLVADTIGTATNALGNFPGGNNFDEMNLLDVILDDDEGELVSVSEEAVLNGANGFLIGSGTLGWEVAQFKTATLTAPGQYTLSGFLRGRYGTEWLIGSHGAGESFILLRPTININLTPGDLFASRKYKAVTLGQPLADATVHDFTNNGVAVKPLSPVLVTSGRNAAGDLFIQWARRTRASGVWLESVEVPVGETYHYYRVFIYPNSSYTPGGHLREMYTPTDQFTNYTAAYQVIDFGSTQAVVYAGIVQGGTYGNGYETKVAI